MSSAPSDSARLQRAADEQLVVAGAVEVAGVDQRHTRLDRGGDGGQALVVVGRAVHARHAHAPEPEGRDHGTGRAEAPSEHASLVDARGANLTRP